MLNYLLELLVMVALGLILYFLARALPRVSDIDTRPVKRLPVPNWTSTYLERFDESVLAAAEKLIRRTRLWILKIDNALLSRLDRFRRPTSDSKAPFLSSSEDSPKDEVGNGAGTVPKA